MEVKEEESTLEKKYYNVSLPEIVTAMWFATTIKETSIIKVNDLNKRLQSIHTVVKDQLIVLQMDKTVVATKMTPFKRTYRSTPKFDPEIETIKLLSWNFYYDDELFNKYKILFNLKSFIGDRISLKNELFQMEISYHYSGSQFPTTPCYFKNCCGSLVTTNRKSSALCYDIENAVTVCKTFAKKCNTCRYIYKHNIIYNDKNIFLIRPNSKYFQSTTETIFTDDILDDFGRFHIKCGVACETYCDNFNSRNNDRMHKIQQILKNNNDPIGHRGYNVALTPQRLSDAFYLRMIVRFVYTNVLKEDEIIKIPMAEIRKKKMKKDLFAKIMNKRINKIPIKRYGDIVKLKEQPEWALGAKGFIGIILHEPIGDHNGTAFGKKYFECAPGHGLILNEAVCDLQEVDRLSTSSPDPDIIFSIVYNQYIKNNIYSIGSSFLDVVPVKDGKAHPGHSCMYGDGNQKITHPICGLSHTLYKILHKEEISQYSLLEMNQKEYYQCDRPFYNGNQYTRPSTVCSEHIYLLLSRSRLTLTDIGDFIKWDYLKHEMERVKKLKQNDVAVAALEKKMTKINGKKKMFEDVVSKLEELQKLKEDRELCDTNLIHHNFSMHHNKKLGMINCRSLFIYFYFSAACMYMYTIYI